MGVPKNWNSIKFEDLCERISNGANVHQHDEPLGYPISRIETIWNEQIDTVRVKYVKENSIEFVSKYSLQTGDILFSHINSDLHLGKTAIFKNQFPVLIHGINLLLIRIKDNVSSDFVNYQFKYKRKLGEFISIAQKSVNQSSINQQKLKNVNILLPSFEVQKQIVIKIEELFSELDKGVEELKKTQQQLKVYRQAVLKSSIKEVGLTKLESVIEKLDQGWSPKCYNEPSHDNNEWAVIKTTAIQSGHFLDNENKRLPEHLKPRQQHELKHGDILITRAGPRVRVGICCMVKKTRERLLNCDKVYRIRLNQKLALPEYLEVILNSPKYSKVIEKLKTGINDSGVNLTQKGFINILIPVPSLAAQKQTVQEIENRLSVCDKIEETITNSLQQTEALRQSILKKAFEGKLV